MRTRSHISGLSKISLLFIIILAVSFSSALAQKGTIVGKIVDKETGQPLAYANVVIGEGMGSMSMADGTFRVKSVPPGDYNVKVMMMGYKEAEKKITLKAGETKRVEFQMEETIVAQTEVIDVTAERKMVDVKSSDVSHAVSGDELEELPVDNIEEALALKTGIVKTGDELHVRGGRGGEVTYLIDGVPVNDPLGGGSISVGMLGASDSKIITGGMDAEYGNAQSAVVDVSTRTGTNTYEGQIRFMTNDFGRKDKTYTNYDRFSIGFGGPTPIKDLTFYLSGQLTFDDGEHWANQEREEHKFWNGLFKFTDRAMHNYNIQGKLAYKATPNLNLVGEAIYTQSRVNMYQGGYAQNWDTQGFVQKVYRFMSLKPSSIEGIESPDAYEFNWTVSVYHGPWIDEDLPRVSEYPIEPEDQRGVIYPVKVYEEVNVGDLSTGIERHVVSYNNFYARRINDVYGNEVEVVWDEAVLDEQGELEKYQSKQMFEGFRNPDSKFSYFRDDSSFVEINSAANQTTRENQNLHVKFGINHTVSEDVLYSVNVSRATFNTYTTVKGKDPEDFTTGGRPVVMPGGSFEFNGVSNTVWYTDPDNPYLVTASYDAPFYMDRNVTVYTAKADLTVLSWEGHEAKTGIQFLYNDLDDFILYYPASLRRFDDGTYMQGASKQDFHNFNPEGSFYVQDKWEYRGIVVNAGVRMDFFSPGNSTDIEIVSGDIDTTVEKFKVQMSPRLGFAFPITDKDKFHFHYGRFTQWPSRAYLFNSQDMISGAGTLGNPNLDEELTVSYQAGVSHQFTPSVAGEVVVFNKDIYGLVSSTRVTDEDTGLTGFRYINRSYASSRGLELSLSKRMTNHVAGEISYTYSFADGVASDANYGVTAEGLSHLPTQEMPLNWDQRHTLNMRMTLMDENNWGATFVYSFGSGLPWTPYDRFARKQDPLDENSERKDQTHMLNLQGRKKFNIYGQELTLYFEGRNLLDEDILNVIAPGVFPGMVNANMDGGAYYTETGKTGGAYLQDIDDDGLEDFNPVNDPTVWGRRRQWRVGFGIDF